MCRHGRAFFEVPYSIHLLVCFWEWKYCWNVVQVSLLTTFEVLTTNSMTVCRFKVFSWNFLKPYFFKFLVVGKFTKRNNPVAFIVVKRAWDAASESSCPSFRRHLGSMTTTTRTLCARDVIVQVSYCRVMFYYVKLILYHGRGMKNRVYC